MNIKIALSRIGLFLICFSIIPNFAYAEVATIKNPPLCYPYNALVPPIECQGLVNDLNQNTYGGCTGSTTYCDLTGGIYIPKDDTRGLSIQAHGYIGMMSGYDNRTGKYTYYWYGQDKGDGGWWSPTINCYSSTNLKDWKFENVIFSVEPELTSRRYDNVYVGCENYSSCLQFNGVGDIGGVMVYNGITEKYVLLGWASSTDPDYNNRHFVATSETPYGHFQFESWLDPDVSIGTIYKEDEQNEDGQYDTYSVNNISYPINDITRTGLVIRKFKQDYSDFDNNFTPIEIITLETDSSVKKPCFNYPYACREAAVMIKRRGVYYLVASTQTGWCPNENGYITANSIEGFRKDNYIWGPGDWTDITDPTKDTCTFYSQTSNIFKIKPNEDNYIFAGNRWTNEFDNDPCDCMWRWGSTYLPNFWCNYNMINATYVWLPLKFDESGKMWLDWYDSWGVDAGAGKFDLDNDGILDEYDNCPTVCNPLQLDANSNGIGDLCDPTPGCGGGCGQPACETPCS